MLFHSPLASSSWPLMVKWKQSWVKKLMSIFPLCPRRQDYVRPAEMWLLRFPAWLLRKRLMCRYHCNLEGEGRLPGGEEGRRVSEKAGERLQSCPWRSGRCTAAAPVVSVKMYPELCLNLPGWIVFWWTGCTWNSRLTSTSSLSSGDLDTGSIRHEQKDLEGI